LFEGETSRERKFRNSLASVNEADVGGRRR